MYNNSVLLFSHQDYDVLLTDYGTLKFLKFECIAIYL